METSGPNIPLYREINDCHEATGFPLRSELPEFYIFTLEDTYPCPRMAMPPFRRGFYQVTLFESMAGAKIHIEDEAIGDTPDVLLFSPPEQILSWVCGGAERGFMLYFKAGLLASLGRAIEEMFPFFESSAANVLPLAPEDRQSLHRHFTALREASRADHAYRLPQLAGLTTAFLYECRGIYDRLGGDQPSRLGSSALVNRFRQMVARCFSHHCTVESYAGCLHVSADHLRAVVKKHTGRTAREFIDERMVLEARRLLVHTDLSIGEVAWHLQFGEPTHFTRFFKRQTGRTPLEFRRESAATVATVA